MHEAQSTPSLVRRFCYYPSSYTMDTVQRAKTRFARLRVHWNRFSQSKSGKWIIWGIRQALTISIGAYLIYQMAQIGWVEIWESMPRTPWFYIIFAGMYLTLPIFQAVIFGFIWGRSPLELLPATIKKRVYNKDVLSYSGDVYLYFWARERIKDWTDRNLVHAIKDNAIVSSVASTIVAFGLLAVFLFSGLVAIPESIARYDILYTTTATLVGAVFLGIGIKFRNSVFGLAGRVLGMLFALHIARLVVVMTLQVLEWSVVVTDVELEIWFTFLSLQIITSRIPFLPSRDLIFMAAGIELAGAVQVSKAAIAGVLAVHSVLDKGVNFLMFGAVSIWDRQTIEELSEMEAPDPNSISDSASQDELSISNDVEDVSSSS